MKSRYDAVVVGAGPGGSIAAREMARGGLDVLLIEKRQEIGVPVRCAEGVSKSSLTMFMPADDSYIAEEANTARIFSPDMTEVSMSVDMMGDEVGYTLERKLFDREVAKSAAAEGAELMVKTRACDLLKDDNGSVIGVRIMRWGEPVDVECDLVVGADGVESKVGRWAGINTALKLKDIESGAQVHLTGIPVDRNCVDFYLGNEKAPGGYVWVFPKGPDSANVGIGVLASMIGEKRPLTLLRDFIAERFPMGKEAEIMFGGVPVSGPIKQTVADNVILVGDAARVTDPITGGGIVNAMKTGDYAAKAALRCHGDGDFSTQALQCYEESWRSTVGVTIEKHLKVKEKFITLKDKTLDNLAHSMKDIRMEKGIGVGVLLKELIKKNPLVFKDLAKLL